MKTIVDFVGTRFDRSSLLVLVAGSLVGLSVACGEESSSPEAKDQATDESPTPPVEAPPPASPPSEREQPEAPEEPEEPTPEEPGPEEPGESCSVDIVPTGTSDAEFFTLCELSGPVQHVVLENTIAEPSHHSAQIYIGFPSAPNGASPILTAGQFRFMLYGGYALGPVTAIPPQVEAYLGAAKYTFSGDKAFVTTRSTVCFDIGDGSANEAPALVWWVSGQKGANCKSSAALTEQAASGVERQWGGAKGALDKSHRLFYRQAAGVTGTRVTLKGQPMLQP